jgi:hypothetical protein
VGHGQARRFLPLQRGFDSFTGTATTASTTSRRTLRDPVDVPRNARTQEDRGTYSTDVFRREALAFVERNLGRPFFLYLPFNAPHSASSFGKPGVQATPEYLARYADSTLPEKVRPYAAAVTCMDDAIGALLAAIEQAGQTSNTLVLFFSDNGGSGNGGNAPLRGPRARCGKAGCACPSRPVARASAGGPRDRCVSLVARADAHVAAVAGPRRPTSTWTFDMMPFSAAKCRRPGPRCSGSGGVTGRPGRPWKWLESGKGTAVRSRRGPGRDEGPFRRETRCAAEVKAGSTRGAKPWTPPSRGAVPTITDPRPPVGSMDPNRRLRAPVESTIRLSAHGYGRARAASQGASAPRRGSRTCSREIREDGLEGATPSASFGALEAFSFPIAPA